MNSTYLALVLSLLAVSAAGFFDEHDEFRDEKEEYLDRNMTCGGFCSETGACMGVDMMVNMVKTFPSACQELLLSRCGTEGENYVECVITAANFSEVCPMDDFTSCMSCYKMCNDEMTKSKCFDSCLTGDDCWSEEELATNIDSYSARCQYCLLRSCGSEELHNLEFFFPAFLDECSFVCPKLSANETKRVDNCRKCVEHCDRQGGEFQLHDGDDDQDEDHDGYAYERDEDDHRYDGDRQDNEEASYTSSRREYEGSYQDRHDDEEEHHFGDGFFEGDIPFAAIASIFGFDRYQGNQEDEDHDDNDSYPDNERRGYRREHSDDDDDRRQYEGGRYSDHDDDDSYPDNERRGYRRGHSDDDDDRRQYEGGKYSDQDDNDSYPDNERRGYRRGHSDDDDDRRQYEGGRYSDQDNDDSYPDNRRRGYRGEQSDDDGDNVDQHRYGNRGYPEDDHHDDESDEENEKCIKSCISIKCPSTDDMKKSVLKLPIRCRRCVQQTCGEDIYDTPCFHDAIAAQCSQKCAPLSDEQKKKETDCKSCIESCSNPEGYPTPAAP